MLKKVIIAFILMLSISVLVSLMEFFGKIEISIWVKQALGVLVIGAVFFSGAIRWWTNKTLIAIILVLTFDISIKVLDLNLSIWIWHGIGIVIVSSVLFFSNIKGFFFPKKGKQGDL